MCLFSRDAEARRSGALALIVGHALIGHTTAGRIARFPAAPTPLCPILKFTVPMFGWWGILQQPFSKWKTSAGAQLASGIGQFKGTANCALTGRRGKIARVFYCA